MRTLYFLNESTSPDSLGHLDIFSSVDLLVRAVEPIDVMNKEYSAFTSDGRVISLSAKSENGPVAFDIEVSPSLSSVARKLIEEFLRTTVSRTRHAVSESNLEKAKSLDDFLALIPPASIVDR